MLDMLFADAAFAMAPPAGGAEGGPMGQLQAFLPLILMFAIFYFLLIRPQQKKQKDHREFLAGLKRGDSVLTNGGIYGRITGISDDMLTIEIAPEISIKVNRNFVSGPSETAIGGGDKPKGGRKGKKDSIGATSAKDAELVDDDK